MQEVWNVVKCSYSACFLCVEGQYCFSGHLYCGCCHPEYRRSSSDAQSWSHVAFVHRPMKTSFKGGGRCLQNTNYLQTNTTQKHQQTKNKTTQIQNTNKNTKHTHTDTDTQTTQIQHTQNNTNTHKQKTQKQTTQIQSTDKKKHNKSVSTKGLKEGDSKK